MRARKWGLDPISAATVRTDTLDTSFWRLSRASPPNKTTVVFGAPNRAPRVVRGEDTRRGPSKTAAMTSYEVSRTLVKSPPELWAELEGERLRDALGEAVVKTMDPERELAWEAEGAAGIARLEPSSWGTKVTLTAWVEEQVAEQGFWGRIRRRRPPDAGRDDLEQKLNGLLDDLGAAHKKPFVRQD